MQCTISTPRLKLTLLEKAERGSQELDWLHELRSDEQTTWWSQHGQSKTIEDTENVLKGVLPTIATPEAEKTYRVVYAVHELLDAAQTRFIGLVTLRSLDANSFALPAHLFPPSTLTVPRSVLTVELGYLFLPIAWSRGFATESVDAVLSACGVAPSYWEPFKQVYVRAVVAAENPASLKVVAKCGMRKLGVHTWKGEKAWLAGQWRDELDFHIWGIWVPE